MLLTLPMLPHEKSARALFTNIDTSASKNAARVPSTQSQTFVLPESIKEGRIKWLTVASAIYSLIESSKILKVGAM
ncbi:hypothetical protein NDU88_002438 [Pleurodeles waltl]|uniref:Uncharacterized protein n=1 Tax=Pleurodeles waltl TaxID=8319 RepID=A0AAV7Q5Z4_PLEWA|nr:hypothetical protein NDU88_002438 [Pleurodeles waltl]